MIRNLKLNKKGIMKLKKGVISVILTSMLASGLAACSNSLNVEAAKHIKEVGSYGAIDTYDSKSKITVLTVSERKIDEELLSLALKSDSTISLVVKSKSRIYADIWKDVDYIKYLLSTYNIKGPIYLDLDSVIDESDLDNTLAVAHEFIKKLESNSIYVGVKGTDRVFSIVNGEFNTQDKCLSLSYEEKSVSLDSYSSIIVSDDNEYYTLYDYKDIISSANLNISDNYVNDATYTVKEGDSLSLVASNYGISVNNLKKYNNLDSEYITVGQVLVIPNKYETTSYQESDLTTYNRVKVDENIYYKGIDVSSYQGDINWNQASEKIDFAIVRIADASNVDENGNIELDKCFKYNIEECNRLGIPVGVYLYSRATTEEQNNKEIKFVIDNIKDYNVTLPVYRDLEGEYANMLAGSESERKLQIGLTEKFCDAIEKSGYASGIYLHKRYLGNIPEIMDKYSVWSQGGWYYSTPDEFDSMAYAYENSSEIFNLNYTVNIFQPTECGSVEGLGITGSTYVDYDYVDQNFVNNLIKKFDKLQNVKIKRNQ